MPLPAPCSGEGRDRLPGARDPRVVRTVHTQGTTLPQGDKRQLGAMAAGQRMEGEEQLWPILS